MEEQLLSVGIDVGTSTTQLVFSQLTIDNRASNFSVPRIEIVDKAVIYRSEIHFTPLLSESRLDGAALRQIIVAEYQKAGVAPKVVDTGAVIITGETARKDNAAEVLTSLSGLAGDFVVATAGPDLESIIAGKGAGAQIYAQTHGTTVVNIDIGGGTSNLAVFAQGEVVDTACLDIGGRLVKIDRDTHQITYIMSKVQQMIAAQGLPLAVGTVATAANMQPLAELMAQVLVQSVGLAPPDALYEQMLTHKGLSQTAGIKAVSFSGGVADYIYEHAPVEDPFCYGDLGILLGQAVARSALCQGLQVIRGAETIGATVVGAGSHTMTVSGSTISYTSQHFPLKNIPILKLTQRDEGQITQALAEKLGWFKHEGVAVGLRGLKNPTFSQIAQYAQGLVTGLHDLMARGLPLIIVLEADMAMVLGQAMHALVGDGAEIICLDGIATEDGDYIDIGHPIAQGRVLPVVVKTIVFNH